MENIQTNLPELPATNSVAALLLLVIANRRSARLFDITDSKEHFDNALAYARSLGWKLSEDENGAVYAASDAAPRGFDSAWDYLRHRVNATTNLKAVLRQTALPRITAMSRQLAALKDPPPRPATARIASAVGPLGAHPIGAPHALPVNKQSSKDGEI